MAQRGRYRRRRELLTGSAGRAETPAGSGIISTGRLGGHAARGAGAVPAGLGGGRFRRRVYREV